ncbi:Group XIIA secretory phospholipase A2 [Oopsacas minuta]|uniref:Group XIIA secretory phospholipase A2 n=1 Tax=Oopsacas minuta TaxID=111878 RepID=A0AAV7JDH6_9METZ|nr:Group XIIA secretory phospholipase A2 [Oopsacas minuta]
MNSVYILLLLFQLSVTWCNLDSDGEEDEFSNFYSDVYDDDNFDILEQADKLFDDAFSSKLTDLSESLSEALGHTKSVTGMVDVIDQMTKNLVSSSDGEKCVFNCKEGLIAIQRDNFVPESNGCGSTLGLMSIQLNTTGYEGIERCCDKHDLCYSTCNDPRKFCDDSFRECMTKYCETDPGIMLGLNERSTEGCVSAAEMIYLGVDMFGCSSYLEAQQEACVCRKDVKQKITLKKGGEKPHAAKSEL